MPKVNWEHVAATIGASSVATGEILTRPSGNGWSNVSYAPGETVDGGGHGYVEWTIGPVVNIPGMLGFSNELPTGYGDTTVESYLIYPYLTGDQWLVYEFGVGEGVVLSQKPVAGDVARIQMDEGVVTYYVNGALVYTSLNPATAVAYHPVTEHYGSGETLTAEVRVNPPATTGAEATFTVEAYLNSAWHTIPDVVAKFGIQLRYGLGGAGIKDRVAQTGLMDFVLDNSEANDAGLVGFYSPNHANIWTEGSDTFDLGVEIRLKVEYGAVTYYKFRGVIDDLDIVAGKYTIGGKKVKVSVTDWMDQAARATVSGIAVQQNKRSDEIFSTILAGMTTQPPATQVGYGQDTYPYALDNTRDESFSVMAEFTRLASSEFGYVFVKGDNVQGGTLVFENRLKRGQKATAVASLDDLSLLALPVSYGRNDILNNVQVQIFPRRIDAAATTVLFTLQNSPNIVAGTTLTVKGIYRDPDSGAKTRVGGIEMVTPVISTDYDFTENADGTGADYSAQLSITPTFAGNSVELAITNNGPFDGYLFLMQTRGKGLYAHETVLFEKADATSQAKYGDNLARISMPYQGDSIIGEEVAHYVLGQNKGAATRVLGATFVGNASDANMLDAIQREISDRIGITEPVTGVDTEYFINAIEWDISPGGIVRCSWTLAPASTQSYWILETTGATELDETTVLAYGLFSPQWQLDVSQLGVDTTVNAV